MQKLGICARVRASLCRALAGDQLAEWVWSTEEGARRCLGRSVGKRTYTKLSNS